jgi:hypothetical protein
MLKTLKMLDTPYVLFFPNCPDVFNMIIMSSFSSAFPRVFGIAE